MEEGQQTGNNSKSPMLLVGVGVIVLIAIGAFVLMRSQNKSAVTTQNQTTQENTTTNTPVTQPVTQDTGTTEGTMDMGKVQEFTVHGGMFYFKPDQLSVKKGDTVKIHFVNDEGMHDWFLDEFNAQTPVIKAGETADVEFVADKVGSFEYYCSVGNHRQMGMVGKLTVTQ